MYTKYPTLYGLAKGGQYKIWEVSAIKEPEVPYALIAVEHGWLKGATQITEKKILGKNIGKANETTPYEQACNEAESLWKKKRDQNYRENIEELVSLPVLPMLALNYKDRKHNVKWPAYAQPKLDGVRCIAKKIDSNTIKYTSRKGKEYETLSHLTNYLLPLLTIGESVDGEIYNPNLSFQETISRVKRVKTDRSDISSNPVQYHIYDFVVEEEGFRDRFDDLSERFISTLTANMTDSKKNPLILVNTVPVNNEDELKEVHQYFVSDGYEGTMIRNANGFYLPDYRSSDLLKYKDFIDAEYEIIGGKQGSGKDEGTVIFRCITSSGTSFDVRPRGTWDQRKQWYDDLDTIIGHMLTVRFQELTDDGIPRFPVGLGIRDYE
jgi:DNA ligase-1